MTSPFDRTAFRWTMLPAILVVALELHPAPLYAQASIAGVVKDSSGAVLPGVTVEAASPALIEKVRSVTSDATGQYRIVDLRPGTYTVTFSLAGFSGVKREGIELAGSFTATVNADMRVGAVAETITVTGATPVVDVQSTTKERVVDQDVIEAIPTARNQYNLGVLIPGALINGGAGSAQDVGGSAGLDAAYSMTIHGSTSDAQRITQNGITLGTILAGGYGGGAVPNPAAVQEWSYDYSGVSAEMATGGVRINFIPKDGGNTFRGAAFGSFANSSLQGSNFSQDLQNRGLLYPPKINRIWDFNPGVGGPFLKDHLWFYTSVRSNGAWNFVPGMVFNANANNPNAWTFAPEPNAPASNNNTWKEAQARLTAQVSRRQKVSVTWDSQNLCECPNAVSSTTAPEAGHERKFPAQNSVQGDWTFPVTNRLLIDGAALYRFEGYTGSPTFCTSLSAQEACLNPQMTSVTELAGSIPGLTYRASPTYSVGHDWAAYYRVSLSYITGSQTFKIGINDGGGSNTSMTYNFQPLSYTFLNGVPQSLTEYATPYTTTTSLDHDLGIYAQDNWTRGRLTLKLGVRYDYTTTGVPAQSLGSGVLVPNRNATFAAQSGLDWKDITPKTGVSYDVFGNGNTAVKAVLSKYLQGQLTGLASSLNPVSTLVTSATRTWNDANHNFVPDCNLQNPAANGECLQLSNANFGTVVPGSTFDPDLLHGWDKRGYNWEFSTSVQQKLSARSSIDVGYFRRWYGNFLVTDNLALAPSDFNTFSIIAPVDPRLPGGGGYTVGPLYNVVPSLFTTPAKNYVTLSDHYGNQIQHWNGIDVNVSDRIGSLLLQGGTSTGRTSTDNCAVLAQIPELSPLAVPYCHQDTNWLTQVKFLGSYQVPKIDVLVSGTLQSSPGVAITGNYNVPFSVYGSSLGRVISGGNANSTVQVNLVAPGTQYGDRLNQVDLRVGKILKYARARISLNVDVYNALNANPVLTLNSTYNAAAAAAASAAWLAPQSILTPRFAKFSASFDF
jgi:Carboxypeptidase regulatory-like domain